MVKKSPTIEVTLAVEKTTKNCVKYVEVDEDGNVRDPKDDANVINRGTLYLSKEVLLEAGYKKAPAEITITITRSES